MARNRKKSNRNEQSPSNGRPMISESEQAIANVGNLNFFNPMGFTVNLDPRDGLATSGKKFGVPGIWKFNVVPSVGVSETAESPINVAAYKFFSYIYHEQSGSTNGLEAPDYMMYMLGVSELYAAYVWLVRMYGCMGSYIADNRYMPRHLVRAMGVDYDSINANLARFRANMDVWAAKINSLALPKQLGLVGRRVEAYSYIYTDSKDLTKCQLYMYNPAFFLRYSGYTDTRGGRLVPHVLIARRFDTALMTYDDIVDMMESLIAPIYGDQDFGLMSAYIMKAYKGDLLSLGTISSDFQVWPVYDEATLDRIHNSIIAPVIKNLDEAIDNYTIFQQVDNEEFPDLAIRCIGYRPYIKMYKYSDSAASLYHSVWAMDRVMDFSKPEPSSRDVFDASRHIIFAKPYDWNQVTSDGTKVYLDSCGVEIIAGSEIYSIEGNANLTHNWVDSSGYMAPDGESNSHNWQWGPFLNYLGMFDRHPILYVRTQSSTLATGPVMSQIDTYARLEPDTVKMMHMKEIMNLVNVPAIGSAFKR